MQNLIFSLSYKSLLKTLHLPLFGLHIKYNIKDINREIIN